MGSSGHRLGWGPPFLPRARVLVQGAPGLCPHGQQSQRLPLSNLGNRQTLLEDPRNGSLSRSRLGNWPGQDLSQALLGGTKLQRWAVWCSSSCEPWLWNQEG